MKRGINNMSSELTEFLKKKTEQAQQEKTTLEEDKQDWLKTVAEFNEKIISWLKEPIEKGFVSYEIENLSINEYLIGTYQVPSLVITSGNDKIYFKPVGKLVLGFNGRIDVVSFTQSKTLVYIKEKGWFFFEQTKRESFKQFTEELFTELLKEMFS